MENYGVLYDGVYGDIDLSFSENTVEIEMENDYPSYLKNMIRNRLKSLDGDYGNAYKYNIFKNMGKGNHKILERAIKNSVIGMLSFDNLISERRLEVEALSERHKMTVGIKVNGVSVSEKGFLEMIIIRQENGKTI